MVGTMRVEPSIPTAGAPLRYRVIATALGPIRIVAKDGAITEISFLRDEPAPEVPEAIEGGPVVDQAAEQLEAYLTGARRGFDLPLAPVGTPHDQEVWRHLQSIPYGTTTTYGEIARAMTPPGSPRAVGTANGRNPIAIVVPCHRVIGANGKLTGYASGVDIKAQLLDLERMGLIP